MSHIEIKFIADSAADLGKMIASLHAQLGTDEIVIGRVPAAEELERPARGWSKAEMQAAERGSAPVAEEGKSSTPSNGEASGDGNCAEISYTDVQTATNLLAKAKGAGAVRAILASLGVDHASKLTEDQWPVYIEACASAVDAG